MRILLIQKFTIQGHSMEPFLKEGSQILVSSIPYLFKKPQIGDVVLVEINKKPMIKRITKIQNEKYFLEGDNKKDSLDSRKFGSVSKENIIGKVFSY